MFQLGGTRLYLGAKDIQIRGAARAPPTPEMLSRYVDGIMARVLSHEDLVEMSRHSTIPSSTGSAIAAPRSGLADFLTRAPVAASTAPPSPNIGDGNNMCHALMSGAVKLGVHGRHARRIRAETALMKERDGAKRRRSDGAGRRWSPRSHGTAGAPTRLHRRLDLHGPGQGRRSRGARPPGLHVDHGDDGGGGPGALFMHCLPRIAARRWRRR